MIKRDFAIRFRSCLTNSQASSKVSFGPTLRGACGGAALFAACALAGPITAAQAGETTVSAVYQINAPIGSGKFRFASSQDGTRYKMQGSAWFKAFLGIYEWNSSLASNGYLYGYDAKPNIYAFNAKADKKYERIRLDFTNAGVSGIKAVPPTKPHPNRVALTKDHLRNVLDPLSAVLAFTDKAPSLTNGTHACGRNVKIFDGRQRFDVQLSFKSKTYVEFAKGETRTAFVCRAKYRPIAGYKKNKSIEYMSSNNGIEVWLVPLPKAKMYVPYKIVIPIMVGTASAELANFQVRDPKAGVIALAK